MFRKHGRDSISRERFRRDVRADHKAPFPCLLQVAVAADLPSFAAVGSETIAPICCRDCIPLNHPHICTHFRPHRDDPSRRSGRRLLLAVRRISCELRRRLVRRRHGHGTPTSIPGAASPWRRQRGADHADPSTTGRRSLEACARRASFQRSAPVCGRKSSLLVLS